MVNVIPTVETVKKGEHTKFNCSAIGVGAGDFKYQWYLNGFAVSVDGSMSSVLVINSVSKDNIGNYTCIVSNSFGGFGQSGVARLYLGTYIAKCSDVVYFCIFY